MSLWWAKREQLDEHQIEIIEKLSLQESCLILGPPGSGKSNILVRRAQFVRSQDMSNVLVLTFTRSLVEFMKTGCIDHRGREIFPKSCVKTIESWIRRIYHQNRTSLPDDEYKNLVEYKRDLAEGAKKFKPGNYHPKYDALFIDEAQDLLMEEIELLRMWSDVLFFVGDDRQQLYKEAEGIKIIQSTPDLKKYTLPFHYRLAPEICRVADRILVPEGENYLQTTEHYNGPKPGAVNINGPLSEDDQVNLAIDKIKKQLRIYADFIKEGDRLGIILARRFNRDRIFEYLEKDPDLNGLSKVIRSRESSEDEYDPTIDPDIPICILTINACKGLEFRAVHWLFCEDNNHHHDDEVYYTVITRAKTSIDIYYEKELPDTIARAHSTKETDLW